MDDIADYEWLTGPEAGRWLEEFADSDESVFRQIDRLRKVLSPERARLVIEQIALRKKAETKFGELANRMYFTDVGLQQATDIWIARYKAARLGATAALDYCCGIGGDLVALAERGPVVGWDRTPQIVCLARANLLAAKSSGCAEVCVGDVEQQPPSGEVVWHLDPDRRVDGRRSTQVQWHSPGPEIVDRWRRSCPNGILKLAPAAQVPDRWQGEAELEWVSRARECRQLLVWFGEQAAGVGKRRATVLIKQEQGEDAWEPLSFVGVPVNAPPTTDRLRQYVYDTDPAVRAAGLVGAIAIELELAAMSSGIGYLTSDKQVDHPLLACFEVVDHLPFRVGPLSKTLRARGIGRLEIKKRGVEITPEKLRSQLKLRGSGSATLLVSKLGVGEIAILARRCEPGGG